VSSVRSNLEETVEDVMADIEKLSSKTEDARKNADEAIDKTFLNPDEATQAFVDNIQSFVDDVIEGKSISQESQDLVQKNVTRFGGRFTKHMEAISNLDDKVRDILVVMMGALSVDDKVSQRLNHLNLCIDAFKVFLSYILIDFENRSSAPKIRSLIEDLEQYTWNIYSTNEERNLHAEILGDDFGRSQESNEKDKKAS
jgi:membrane-associated HD superfamily phosphohydrolase